MMCGPEDMEAMPGLVSTTVMQVLQCDGTDSSTPAKGVEHFEKHFDGGSSRIVGLRGSPRARNPIKLMDPRHDAQPACNAQSQRSANFEGVGHHIDTIDCMQMVALPCNA